MEDSETYRGKGRKIWKFFHICIPKNAYSTYLPTAVVVVNEKSIFEAKNHMNYHETNIAVSHTLHLVLSNKLLPPHHVPSSYFRAHCLLRQVANVFTKQKVNKEN